MRNKIFGKRLISVTTFRLKSKANATRLLKQVKDLLSHRLHEQGAQLVCVGISQNKKKVLLQSHWEGNDRKKRLKQFNELTEIQEALLRIGASCKKVKRQNFDQVVE